MTIHTDIQYYAICKAYSCLAFSSTAETFCLQGKLLTTQRKCKATSDLANGTILQYPSPYFIDSVTRILPKSGYSFCSHCTSQRLSRLQGYELPCIFHACQWQMCDSTHRIQAGATSFVTPVRWRAVGVAGVVTGVGALDVARWRKTFHTLSLPRLQHTCVL
jgi:hypothetical protein